MHILGIITARGKSKGLRNKHCLFVRGKPVIWHTIHDAKASKIITRVICSSDSKAILNIAKNFGVEPLVRPAKYARDGSSIEEPIRHALAYLKKKENYAPDIVVILYGNVPYRKRGLIDGALSMLVRTHADAVVSVSKTDRFHPERLVSIGTKDIFQLYTKKISSFRRQDLQSVYFIDSGIIAFKSKLLFGKDPLVISHYFKGHKVCAYASDDLGAWDIDNQFEFDIAKLILERRKSNDIVL